MIKLKNLLSEEAIEKNTMIYIKNQIDLLMMIIGGYIRLL